ncbi:mitochondrial carrier [Stereum hirsutum FP-91666 SS1]|uniref:mitochondrial carrier n=1 Tax=Stereum hirsutum (strain FP-91666) TaxID=721885 RepID=UPI0004449A89|nr:mitochondrial carrier [Stereum hirsutum FP-91666 SS1]EIM86944.1 mitochondrial carrier [Stereum hirsutum FP-91666 SS1]
MVNIDLNRVLVLVVDAVDLDPTLDFAAGTIAGMAALVVGYPFDTGDVPQHRHIVKVRFQSPATQARYRSTSHAITTIVREERFLGLYKGIYSPLASCALLNGIVFASYRFFLRLQLHHAGQVPTLTQIGLAGAGCGVVSAYVALSSVARTAEVTLKFITAPIELIKIHQQQSLEPIHIRGSTSSTTPTARALAAQIFKERGIAGLYRGITATVLRDTGYGAYFLGYEATIRFLSPPLSSPAHMANQDPLLAEMSTTLSLSWAPLLIAGGVAGILGWVCTFPFDIVKTRIQGSFDGSIPGTHPHPHQSLSTSPSPTPRPTSSPSPVRAPASTSPLLPNPSSTPSGGGGGSVSTDLYPYRTTWSTIVHSYRTEGVRVFFRGLAPTLIRAIPVNMVTFGTFEAIVHAFS